MKKLSFINKLIFVSNSLFAVLLLLGYLLPYLTPRLFPRLSVLSLLLPVLLVINVGFAVYWAVGLRRQFLLSSIVLLAGIQHISGLYKLGDIAQKTPNDITILSYNVKTFRTTGTYPKKDIQATIYNFIKKEDPDIICFQEYADIEGGVELNYPYQYRKMKRLKNSFGQVIFSKYPILNSGSFDFKKTSNNIIYADLVINRDTVRVYNVHLQSLKVSSDFTALQQEDSKRLLSRIGTTFKRQEEQVQVFLKNEQASPFPVIVAGDFNNSATSYIYRKIRGDKEDAFAKAGTGTGRTFTFDFLPLRIDFVLSDPKFEVTRFQNFEISLSDHEPILASFKPLD